MSATLEKIGYDFLLTIMSPTKFSTSYINRILSMVSSTYCLHVDNIFRCGSFSSTFVNVGHTRIWVSNILPTSVYFHHEVSSSLISLPTLKTSLKRKQVSASIRVIFLHIQPSNANELNLDYPVSKPTISHFMETNG